MAAHAPGNGMEKQQPLHRSRQPQSPRSKQLSQPLRSSNASLSRGKSGWNLALVLLGSAWLAMMVIALIAISGLLSPNLSSSDPPRGTAAVRVATSKAHAPSQTHVPLWLFGAIALSCAAGSMLISSQANRPPRSRKSVKPKRLKPYIGPEAPEPVAPTITQPPVVTLTSLALRPQPQPPAPAAAPFMAPTTLMQLAQQVSQATGASANAPTAIAPDDTRPLDWGEASLADRLDIRKPRSVSSLL